MQPIVAVQKMTVLYAGVPALEAVQFEIQAGDSVAIIGPNGAGKSTLMKALMGLLPVQPDCDIRFAPGITLPGYVPQYQDVNSDFPVTVQDVVLMGLVRQIGWLKRANQQHRQQVLAALDMVGMQPYAQRQIGELSGGQQRRVFIARALVQNVALLLLDEPFAGVDVGAQADLMTVIDDLNQQGITILLSTHDLTLAFQRFKTVMALNRKLIAIGKPSEVARADVLRELYGGIIVGNGQSMTLFVDDHGCC
jgi:ABC-type Mn2+/Zn2+ transport system ATPase subunit